MIETQEAIVFGNEAESLNDADNIQRLGVVFIWVAVVAELEQHVLNLCHILRGII